MTSPDLSHLSPQEALLRELLAGAVPDLERLRGLIERRVEEDLHLDYKSGRIFNKESGKAEVGHPKNFAGKVRKYVAGFANSEGGVLIIGISEPPRQAERPEQIRHPQGRTFEPVNVPTTKLESDAREAVRKLRASLYPTPRIFPVEHPDGALLVVAVPRSEGVVSCIEREQPIYYLRIHDCTAHAPAYLVHDLILGRRRRPTFNIRMIQANAQYDRRSDGLNFQIYLRVMNTGLVWMDQPQMGIVGFTDVGSPGEEYSSELDEYVDVRQWTVETGPRVVPLRLRAAMGAEIVAVAPFQYIDGRPKTQSTFWTRAHGQVYWAAALYVVCHNQPPRWYQILILYNRHGDSGQWLFPIKRGRPVVAVHQRNDSSQVWLPSIDWFEVDGHLGNRTLRLTGEGTSG